MEAQPGQEVRGGGGVLHLLLRTARLEPPTAETGLQVSSRKQWLYCVKFPFSYFSDLLEHVRMLSPARAQSRDNNFLFPPQDLQEEVPLCVPVQVVRHQQQLHLPAVQEQILRTNLSLLAGALCDLL